MNKNLILEEQNPFQKLLNWKGWLKKTPQNSNTHRYTFIPTGISSINIQIRSNSFIL